MPDATKPAKPEKPSRTLKQCREDLAGAAKDLILHRDALRDSLYADGKTPSDADPELLRLQALNHAADCADRAAKALP